MAQLKSAHAGRQRGIVEGLSACRRRVHFGQIAGRDQQPPQRHGSGVGISRSQLRSRPRQGYESRIPLQAPEPNQRLVQQPIVPERRLQGFEHAFGVLRVSQGIDDGGGIERLAW